jgi:hypothetical protein
MQLGVSNDALQVNGLFRNNSGANYPYNIAEALEITASSANTNPYEYYYFFYNIEVEIACYDISATVDNISPKKTLVKVIDILGRENESKNSLPKIFIYEDGTIEKKIIVE